METDNNSRSGFRVLCAARDIEEPGLWGLGRKGYVLRTMYGVTEPQINYSVFMFDLDTEYTNPL